VRARHGRLHDDRAIATDLVQMGFGGDFTLHREK